MRTSVKLIIAAGAAAGAATLATRQWWRTWGRLPELEGEPLPGDDLVPGPRVVLQAGPQILSLPLGADAAMHAGAIGAFVEGGGWVAWGVVPTSGPLGTTPERLWQHLSTEWCSLTQGGCDPVLLREQSLITPACGLALHGEAQADLVLGLASQVARRLETQTQGMRLTVGA